MVLLKIRIVGSIGMRTQYLDFEEFKAFDEWHNVVTMYVLSENLEDHIDQISTLPAGANIRFDYNCPSDLMDYIQLKFTGVNVKRSLVGDL